MTFPSQAVTAALLLAAAAGAGAQTYPPPQNVVSLTAMATVELTKDTLAIAFTATREGTDAATVQNQLKQVLDAALAEARKAARPGGALEVQTGNFGLYPRYSPKGGINGWQGSAELLVEGRDIPAVAQLAGRLPGMTVGRVAFSLSREAREKVEADVTKDAIARFRQKAEGVSREFGYGGYTIREISVNVGEGGGQPVPMFRAGLATAQSDAPLPAEAGKAAVSATISGSVVMSPGR